MDVLTGLIKANFPTRISFKVSSKIDSRTILDTPGAERLLGRGDMLFMRPDSSKLDRLQGAWGSESELERIVRYWKGMRMLEGGDRAGASGVRGLATAPPLEVGEAVQRPLWEEMIEKERKAAQQDDLYEDALEVVRTAGRASVLALTAATARRLLWAARLIDILEEEGMRSARMKAGRTAEKCWSEILRRMRRMTDQLPLYLAGRHRLRYNGAWSR